MNLMCDWYTAQRFPPSNRERIAALVPEGHRLTVTHGGREYTANVYAPDRERIARREALTAEKACERVLSDLPGVIA